MPASYAETSKAPALAGRKPRFLLDSALVPDSAMIVWKVTVGIQGVLRGKDWAGGILRQFSYSNPREAITLGVAFVGFRLTSTHVKGAKSPRGLNISQGEDCVFSVAVSLFHRLCRISVGLISCGALSPWPPASCKRHFFLRANKLLLLHAGLTYRPPPSCTGWRTVGAESFSTGKPGCAGGLWAHGTPCHKARGDGEEGSRGLSSSGAFAVIPTSPHSSPPMDPHLAPLTQGSANDGSLPPAFTTEVLLEHSHPVTCILSVAAF